MKKNRLKTLAKLSLFFGFMALLASLLTFGAPGMFKGKSTWESWCSAFSALMGFVVVSLLAIYPLLLRLYRALTPISVRNQVSALMDLSKDANWDANDMGRRLSKLSAWSPSNGERLTRGVLLAGFPSGVIEEFAKKNGDTTLHRMVDEHREEEHERILNLLLIAPWLALIALLGLPAFVKAFLAWSLEGRVIFILIWAVIYGVIPIQSFLDYLKKK